MGTRRAAVLVADWLEGLSLKARAWKTLFAFLGGGAWAWGSQLHCQPHSGPGSRFRSPQVAPGEPVSPGRTLSHLQLALYFLRDGN